MLGTKVTLAHQPLCCDEAMLQRLYWWKTECAVLEQLTASYSSHTKEIRQYQLEVRQACVVAYGHNMRSHYSVRLLMQCGRQKLCRQVQRSCRYPVSPACCVQLGLQVMAAQMLTSLGNKQAQQRCSCWPNSAFCPSRMVMCRWYT